VRVVPLGAFVTWRAWALPGAHAQPEVRVIEAAGDRVAAGHDRRPSSCVLLFNNADKRTQDYFIEGSYPPPQTIARVY